ncbi:hypothetical protein VRK_32790 [Vibrio sp. MEBiC08052]|nr:hypothetical protein VRK_32790 [Vibrio sp. MEBiC08052]
MFGYAMKDKRLEQTVFELHQTTERCFACTLSCTNYLPKSYNV